MLGVFLFYCRICLIFLGIDTTEAATEDSTES